MDLTSGPPDAGRVATTYVKWRNGHPELCRAIGRLANLTNRSNILDIGCGPGLEAREFLRLYRTRYTGIDRSATMVAAASQYLAGLCRWSILRADATDLPFPGASFDAVLFMLSLHQMGDKDRALEEAARVLQPGGTLVVVTVTEEDRHELIEFRCFPRLAEIERRRSVETSCLKRLMSRVPSLEGVSVRRCVYEIRRINERHLERLREKYFSSLELLDRRSFSVGLRRLEGTVTGEAFSETVWCRVVTARASVQVSVNGSQ